MVGLQKTIQALVSDYCNLDVPVSTLFALFECIECFEWVCIEACLNNSYAQLLKSDLQHRHQHYKNAGCASGDNIFVIRGAARDKPRCLTPLKQRSITTINKTQDLACVNKTPNSQLLTAKWQHNKAALSHHQLIDTSAMACVSSYSEPWAALIRACFFNPRALTHWRFQTIKFNLSPLKKYYNKTT